MIEARELTKHFDDFHAVESVSLGVPAGQVLALLGPNGAGKTTTVRMLTSILKPTSGTASVAGYDVVREPDGVRASVGVLTENHGLYLRSSGTEYLNFFGELYGLDANHRRRRIAELAERFGMAEAAPHRRILERHAAKAGDHPRHVARPARAFVGRTDFGHGPAEREAGARRHRRPAPRPPRHYHLHA